MGNECGCTCVAKTPGVLNSDESLQHNSSTGSGSPSSTQPDIRVRNNYTSIRVQNRSGIRKLQDNLDLKYTNNTNPDVLKV